MSEVITPVTVIGDSAIGGTSTVDSGDITVVAGNLSAVDIVSNNIDSVVTDANSIDSINTLAASNSQLLNLNSNLSTIETVNSKLGEINRYYTTFLGSSAADPTVRVDGSPLQVGDMYYSTTMPGMKVRGATAWATSAGGVPVNNSTLTGSTSIQNLTVSNAFNANGYAQFNSSDAFKIPSGTTAQRPSPVSGQLRFNTTTGEFEGFNGLLWGGIGGTTSGGSAGSTAYVRQTFTATAGQTTFTITGGYTPGKIDVFKNGIKLVNGSTVTVTSGASVVLSAGATAGDIIDVVGLASGYFDSPAIPKRLAFTATAGQTLFTVIGGYTPNQLDVFQNGTKLVTGTDVDVSSGTTFTLVEPATAGDIVEVVGFTAADTISGTLKFHAGTVSAPSITAFEDTDTGVYFPAANTLAVTTNGVQRASIDGSGNTALTGNLAVSGTSTLSGNTSVTGTLGVTGNTTVGGTLGVTSNATVGGTLGVTSNATVGGTLGVTGTSNLANTSITGTITGSTNVVNIGSGQIYKDASGNVGIGTNNPQNILHVASSNASVRIQDTDTVGDGTNSLSAFVTLRDSSASQVGYMGFGGSSTFDITNETASAMRFLTSGVERLRIDTSGNVGIGTTSPAAKIHVSGTDGTASEVRIASTTSNTGGRLTFYENANPAHEIRSGGANNFFAIRDAFNNTERLRIDTSGRVGIGTTSPVKELQINGTEPTIRLEESGAGAKRLELSVSSSAEAKVFATQSGSALLLGTVGTERLRIDSSGNVGIGSTAPNARLLVRAGEPPNSAQLVIGYLNGSENYYDANTHYFRNGSSVEVMRINAGNLMVGKTSLSTSTVGFQFDLANQKITSGANGGATALFNRNGDDGTVVQIARDGAVKGGISVTTTAVAYNTTSDYRLKTNLEPISNGIDRVKQLPVYRFNWIANENGNKVDGFLAHEAKAIVPECINGEKDAVDAEGNPIYQGIDQSKIVPLLTAALKEAIAKIEILESKVAALEAA